MLTWPRTSARNWLQNPGSVYFQAMGRRGKVTDCITQGAKESFIAGMLCLKNLGRGIEKESSAQAERSSDRYVELDFPDDEKLAADNQETVTWDGAEPVVRRSSREKKAPYCFGEWESDTNTELTEPLKKYLIARERQSGSKQWRRKLSPCERMILRSWGSARGGKLWEASGFSR